MKFIKYCLIFTVLTIFSGCTSMQYNYIPSTQNISYPEIDKPKIANIGDFIIKQGTLVSNEMLIIDKPTKISWAYTLLEGDYIKKGFDDNSNYFYPYRNGANIQRNPFADPWIGIKVINEKKEICVITSFGATSCNDNLEYKILNVQLESLNSFQQTLIYSGKIGNKINLGYREYSSNLARPAFNNDVTYDLSQSNIIGYKGARIKVLEASNEYIKYIVLKNFNQ